MSRRRIINGQSIKEWQSSMNESGVFIALIDNNQFCDNMECLEQVIYAKSQKIPTIILWKEGMELSVPDLFEGVNVVITYHYNEHNKYKIKEKLINKINELQKAHQNTKKQKGNLNSV